MRVLDLCAARCDRCDGTGVEEIDLNANDLLAQLRACLKAVEAARTAAVTRRSTPAEGGA